SLREQRAATGSPSAGPVARERRAERCLNGARRVDLTGLDDVADETHERVELHPHRLHEKQALASCEQSKLANLIRVEADRFLAQHVLAMKQSGLGEFEVRHVRRGKIDDFDV